MGDNKYIQEKQVRETYRYCKLTSCPNSEGMPPMRLFVARSLCWEGVVCEGYMDNKIERAHEKKMKLHTGLLN